MLEVLAWEFVMFLWGVASLFMWELSEIAIDNQRWQKTVEEPVSAAVDVSKQGYTNWHQPEPKGVPSTGRSRTSARCLGLEPVHNSDSGC